MKWIAPLALVVASCGYREDAVRETPGSGLEAAALSVGLVADPATASVVGAWARDTDRVCVIPRKRGYVVGVRIDYGEGQGCAASGAATRSGDRLRVVFGECRLDARFDGDRLVFPPLVPGVCDSLCTGRASLAALAVDRLSTSRSEALTLRAPNGAALCPN